MVDVLVCAASVYEARSVPHSAPVLVTGPNNSYAATALTASLIATPPWDRPKLIVGIGMVSRLTGKHEVGSLVVPRSVSLWAHEDKEGFAAMEMDDTLGELPLNGSDAAMTSGDTLVPSEAPAMIEQGYAFYDVGGYGVAMAARFASIPCALVRVVADDGDGQIVDRRTTHLADNAAALGAWVASLRSRLR